MEAINKAQPGDQIILKDGRYDASEWLETHSADTMLTKARGKRDAPIVMSAETVDGVEIIGPAGFAFEGSSYLVIRGFKFLHDQIDDSISIECSDCRHVRFTQNYFDLAEPNGSSDWLGITGRHSEYSRIDHNMFANKETAGNFVLILGSDGEMSRHNKIDLNYFANHTYSSSNGGECLRIGNSAYATSDATTIVEYNVFEKCNGDAEVISVKSSKIQLGSMY
jgi:poly(beta-D-mannuronate) lyase